MKPLTRVIGCLIFSLGITPAFAKKLPADNSQSAVAYQINVAHTGAITFTNAFSPPLNEIWRKDLGGAISYPLIAEGKVFVTVVEAGGGYGTMLYALDQTNGTSVWGPVVLDGTYFWANAAYDQGQVFVVNFDGLLKAFDAKTGNVNWSVQLPGQYAFSSAPTAANGTVYIGGAGSGGTLYAVNETNGEVLWTGSVANGDNSSPALSADSVFVSYACPQSYKFDRLTGNQLWHYSGPCSGGGGKTTVYYNGRLYVRDVFFDDDYTVNGYALDAISGQPTGHFSASAAPAFSGKLGFFLNNGTLQAKTTDTDQTVWSFAGDGALSTAPIVVNNVVYVGSTSGSLYALNTTSGEQISQINVGASIPAPDEHNVSQPLTGLSAGEEMIVVPAGNTLVAFKAVCTMHHHIKGALGAKSGQPTFDAALDLNHDDRIDSNDLAILERRVPKGKPCK
ncbi:MAG: PQQ-binding-like beta-propeller repeat protein [Pseudomonadota bacterium]